jgi:hypothetical protein
MAGVSPRSFLTAEAQRTLNRGAWCAPSREGTNRKNGEVFDAVAGEQDPDSIHRQPIARRSIDFAPHGQKRDAEWHGHSPFHGLDQGHNNVE